MDPDWERWQPVLDALALHPAYAETFQNSLAYIFYGDGPVIQCSRLYIVLMAVSRHSCKFLLELFTHEFQRSIQEEDDEQNWLQGLSYAPAKLKSIDCLNRLLAHQPWVVSPTHIEELIKASGESNTSKWSLHELIHVLVLITHAHGLCSLIYGCGISALSDGFSKNGTLINGTGGENAERLECEVPTLLARLQELKECHQEKDAEERFKQFVDINKESSELSPNTNDVLKKAPNSPGRPIFSEKLDFSYIDFVRRGDASASPTLKIHDFSWEDQGYGLLYQLCSRLCDTMDSKFRIIKSLTYNTMGSHENVDTLKYRTAIWNYIQSLYGIRYDDYDYAEVNQMLSIKMKTFVKTTCCFPEKLSEELRNSVMTDFKKSEKVHVNLIIAEARMQAELLYALRAIMLERKTIS